MLQTLFDAVEAAANERSAELLPALLAIYQQREDTPYCERHHKCLRPYVQAQLNLHHTKKRYLKTDTAMYVADYYDALRRRRIERDIYRNTPCTCKVRRR